ncbi:MAG TPA: chemotaxis-specific protein-glutamate methyltransferase CheB [Spirochaetota bacterium]|nr:chemotaxis-specific protein-glutamate methyltransferase CheB [Spirochaetota bacterium]HOK91510.1 chemotaxis-specific protein-glutamate methyltransferase CheB [Spirochaetota bacterium]HOQ11907.1 chemotaxis-specific protein-glutamate methyltransferase CheB [Spirochaetota bacterium]HPP93993.1 chemotaxis-specific protein-glutamate methyltransferase CheB [Spirochaetota bacterium]HRS62037.1 chemotaxis-specific protein-glutamate methyltransferase CheB [Spirochaetota bacterium]
MIKVLIVDDSKVDAEMLSYILSSDSNITVVGIVESGLEAVKIIKEKSPDVVTMDINFPGFDGLTITREIMQSKAIPIVVISSAYKKNNTSLAFKAIESGALAILEKPVSLLHPDFERQKKEIIKTVKLMSEIKVVTRKAKESQSLFQNGNISLEKKSLQIIAVGASTGGPVAVLELLKNFKRVDFPPILVVQHITSGFSKGFADWLRDSTSLDVRIAINGERLQNSVVYVAPDDLHLGVTKNGIIVLDDGPEIHHVRPSVSYLFNSVALNYGEKSVGILLTGMGTDGAKELKLMRECGAVTFAQDEESSVVYGMPGEAARIGAAQYIMPVDKIAYTLLDLIGERNGKS